MSLIDFKEKLLYQIGDDFGKAKDDLVAMTNAFERREDFIRWIVETKLENEYSLSNLWDEYEEHELNDV